MNNSKWGILAASFLVASLSGCGSMFKPPDYQPHENFKHFLETRIGMKYDDPSSVTGINTEGFISSIILLNGNMENGYLHRGSCKYYFEINPNTRKIVGWRYTGSDHDCAIE